MRYAIVIENAGPNYSAYVPDLPGCVATGVPLRTSSARSARLSRFISRGFARMALRSHLRRALSDTRTSRPDPAFERDVPPAGHGDQLERRWRRVAPHLVRWASEYSDWGFA
jgi:hypothetical protein